MANRNTIIVGSTTYTDDNLYGGVKYRFDIVEGEQIELGATPSAEIRFKLDTKISLNTQITYKKYDTTIGTFYVTDCTRDTSSNLYDITAYDEMILLNGDASEWSKNLTFPQTLYSLYWSLASYFGLNGTGTLLNSAFPITEKTWSDDNLTGRIMLKYIGQIAGGYFYANNGKLYYGDFTVENPISITNNDWKTRTIAEYTCPVIDKVWAGAMDGDVGYSYGSGDNALKIVGNPLLYSSLTSACETVVHNIYVRTNRIRAYTPCEIEVFSPNLDSLKHHLF